MKCKKAKTNKKRMSVYKTSYGFREPYQVIVDGNFLHAIVTAQIPMEEALSQLLVGQVKTLISICSHEEIKGLGDMCGKARKAAYNIEKRKCRHHPLRHGGECLMDLIGDENKHRYCVATQDEALRERLRHVPGVPIIYFDHGMLLLEPVSDVTKQQRERIERGKLAVSSEERNILHKLSGLPAPKRRAQAPRTKTRKGPKAPNPLSCKKKKTTQQPSDTEKRRGKRGGSKTKPTLEEILASS